MVGPAKASFAIAAGLALGYVLAGLATEITEEMAFHARGDTMFAALTVTKALTLLAVTAILAWGAWRRREGATAVLLAPLAISTPAWYAFYEVDHTEAAIGIALALGLACAGTARASGTALRMALLAGAALAAALAVRWVEVPLVLQAAAVLSVAALGWSAGQPAHRRMQAARAGTVAWLALAPASAWPGAVDQAAGGHLVVLAAACLALAAAVALAAVPEAPRPAA